MIDDPLDVFLADFSLPEELVFEFEGGCKSLRGIFDNSFVDVNIGEMILDTTAPRVTCKYDDAKHVPRESIVEINGSTYSVTQVQPDGTGFAVITLAHEK